MGAKNPLRFDTVFEMAKTKPAWTGANSIILEKIEWKPTLLHEGTKDH